MVDRSIKLVFVCLVFLSFLFWTTVEQQLQQQQQKQQVLNSGVERFALLRLRSSLGLRAKQWPLKLEPCLFWKGIHCLNGHVTGINISGFKRTRVARRKPQFSVDALQNFTFLASFNASDFALPGSIPDWFGLKLASLQVIDLRSCSISGSIPSTIGNLSSLTGLYLSDNRLSGAIPASLSQLISLEVLDLSRNSLAGMIPESLAALGNLSLLNVSVNSLTGSIPPGIGNLSKLKFLNLSGNSLSSLIPPQLGDLSNLVDLDLGFNSLSGPIPPDLRGLRSLQRLVIGNNSLSGPLPMNLFLPLTQLQFLVMSHNDFTGPLPDMLWSMAQLRFLDVSGNNFSSTLPKVGSSANTTVFNLSRNSLFGSITPVVGGFRVIDLSGNYIEGTVPDYAQGKVMVVDNCLQNVSNQKSQDECASFYSEKGLTFDNFEMLNGTQPPPPLPGSKKKSHRTLIILVSALVGTGVLVLVVVLLVLLIVCCRKKSATVERDTGLGPVPAGASPSPHSMPSDFSNIGDVFTYQQIIQATSEFSNENFMKNGHSGDLFRGILEGGIPVVIKRINLQSVNKEAYLSELDFFSKVSHPRFVPFLGHCLEHDDERILVYRFMPNRDLSGSLFKSSDDDSLQSLDWITRLKIAIGAAEALSYLHHELTPPFVHRNVEASSILLDDKFEVRLGSLSDVCVQEDNHQNMITRMLRLPQTSDHGNSGTANSTCAYDVYCFGKVLLELVTGKLGMSACRDATTMKEWLEQTLPYISIYDKELLTNILDPSLIIDEDLLEEVWAMAIVAKSCLNPRQSKRPLMRYILKALENPLKVVRGGDEHASSGRLKATSSRSSWNAALFGSWRSSSDVAAIPAASGATTSKVEGGGGDSSSLKQSGSQESGGHHNSSSRRRHSMEIYPEPLDDDDVDDAERQNED